MDEARGRTAVDSSVAFVYPFASGMTSYNHSRPGARGRRAAIALVVGLSTGIAATAAAQLVAPKPHPAPALEYPAGAGHAAVSVRLQVTIDRDGVVTEAVEQDRTPADAPDVFVARAIEYARTLTFDPATKDGAPIVATIPFVIRYEPPPAPSESASEAIGPSATVAPSASISAAPKSAASSGTGGEIAAAMGDEKEGDRHPHSETDISVIGRTEPRSRGNSDYHVHIGSLGLIPRSNASDLLKLAPGILLTNEGGEGHAEQVFLRGFDAREGQDIEFTAGGVPINDAGNLHGNGYADTHFIIPELVSSLRVVEGPFSPEQGNFAVAGSADYELGLERRGLTSKVTYGSFGTQRMLLLWGPARETTHTFGGVEIYKTDGFGMNRDARRATAMGQYEGAVGTNGSYRVTATAYGTSYHSAGVLREDDYDTGRLRFFDSYDPMQGGDSSRYSLAADYETSSEDVTYQQLVFVTSRGMRLRENFTGFLLDPQDPQQSPHGQRGDLLDLHFDAVTLGAKGAARLKGKLGDLPQELELGYYARGDQTASTQYRVEGSTGHPYRRETDLVAKVGDIGLFVDANLKLLKWLTLRGGMRADLFSYDVLDNCAVQSVSHPSRSNPETDSSCLSQEGFGAHREPIQRSSTASAAVMPRASLLLGPIQHFTFSFSCGHGIRSIDPIYVTQDNQTPFASVRAYEGGVGYARSSDELTLVVRSVFFQTRVDRDLLFSETQGRNTLGGGTTRTGWSGSVRGTGSFLDESANVTLVRSTFDDTQELVPYIPDVVVRSDTVLFAEMPWTFAKQPVKGSIGAGITYVGRRPLPYGQRSDVIAAVDASATLAWSIFELGLTVTNVLGQRYRLGEFNYASDFHSQSQPTLVPMRHFSAGAPRGIFLSLSTTFGGT